MGLGMPINWQYCTLLWFCPSVGHHCMLCIYFHFVRIDRCALIETKHELTIKLTL